METCNQDLFLSIYAKVEKEKKKIKPCLVETVDKKGKIKHLSLMSY